MQQVNSLKSTVKSILELISYSSPTSRFFNVAANSKTPRIFIENCGLPDIFDKVRVVDFMLHDPSKFSNLLMIDCIPQDSSDPVDEKFPYFVECAEKNAIPTILVIENHKYCPKAEEWLRSQSGKKYLDHVFNEDEFREFVREGGL